MLFPYSHPLSAPKIRFTISGALRLCVCIYVRMHICMSLTSIAARQRQSPALVVLLQAQEVRCAIAIRHEGFLRRILLRRQHSNWPTFTSDAHAAIKHFRQCYNMTAIARFYNKFLLFIELDPARPDPTRGSTRPACNSAFTTA